jgi:hypothetical protein
MLNPRLGRAEQVKYQLVTLVDVKIVVDGSTHIFKHTSQSAKISNFEVVHILEVPEVVLEVMRKSAIK